MVETVQLTPDHVRAFLAPHGIDVQELPADTSTAVLAAEALGTEVGAIVKSLLFEVDGEPVLVLACGDRKINDRVLAREVGGRKARLAAPSVTLQITGYPVGGVPPVAHLRPLRTFMDRALLDRTVVYAAAGAYNAIFEVAPDRLQEIVRAELSDSAR